MKLVFVKEDEAFVLKYEILIWKKTNFHALISSQNT